MSLDNNKGYFAALLAVFIWGAFPTLLKETLVELKQVEQFLAIRFLFSTILLMPFLPKALSKLKQIDRFVVGAFIVTTVTVFYSQTYALNQVPASWYVAAFTFVPVIFLMLSKASLNYLEKLGSSTAMLGMLVFFSSLSYEKQMQFSGFVLLMISILSWVAYSLLAKKLHSKLTDFELVALTCFIGLMASTLFWGVQGFQTEPLSIKGITLCVLTAMVVLVALMAYSFSLRVNPVFAVFSQYLEPVLGLMIAALFLRESMCFVQYLAASLIILGTFFIGFASRKKNAEAVSLS
ncbi:MAG: DMT family transporter [Psychrobacter sp.]|nr:DMT family transporter [Psychrobacter sp.]